MSKINVLDSSIFNRISAGEVVEKPASVIKELVENSLDAGATSIVIDIIGGGIKQIKISDNGGGIAFDDLKKAFLPHATSKIKNIDDLDSIATLGFRGEALASIASVAQIVLNSKQKNSEVSGEIKVEGGKIFEPTVSSGTDGTFIKISNLFFNVPARAKFLKSPKNEESAITNLMARLILANPKVAFKYSADNVLIYKTEGQGLEEAIFVIYGKDAIKNCLPIKFQNDFCSISGFISKPTFCKANKTYQTLIINNRFVQNNLISASVYNAYENFMMKGKFPFYVLNLSLPYADIDVNVHPNKLEVKFKNSQQIYMSFLNAVSKCLLDCNNVSDVEVENNSIIFKSNLPTNKELPKICGGASFGATTNEIKSKEVSNELLEKFKKEVKSTTIIASDNTFNGNLDLKSDGGSYFALSKAVEQQRQLANNIDNQNVNKQSLFEDSEYKIIGNVFNTYIIVQANDDVYFIDQHAGHERLLYDKFCLEYENKKVVMQDLLVPYVFNLNDIESNLIKEEIDVFATLGFVIDEFGNNCFKISSVPLMLSKINLASFIDDCLKNITKISKNSSQIKHFLATSACKAAVKGGQKLSDNEMETLIKNLINNKTVLLCPHGRPICVRLNKTEIEKLFKRIV